MEYDVVIIGSGPAGLSAAVYLKRAMRSVLVIEKEYLSGGQMLLTNEIDNYLGFNHIDGFTLAQKCRQHAQDMGAEFLMAEVKSIAQNEVVLADKTKIRAKAIVVATGASHKKLGVAQEDTFAGRGVSYCALCDGAFFKDKSVAVVGGGDSAAEAGVYLAGICRDVTLIHRRNTFRANNKIVDMLQKCSNVNFALCDEIVSLYGTDSLAGVTLKSGKSLAVAGLFVAIGQVANTAFLPDTVSLAADGSILTDENCATSSKGIFAVGDVRHKACKQIATAVADGAISSAAILQFLNGDSNEINH